MKAYKIRKEAADEIAEAAAWYETEAGPDLGADLIAVLERFRKEHPQDPLPVIVPAVVSHAPGG